MSKTGVSLLEVIMVIIIIAIAGALGVVNYYRVMEEAHDKDVKVKLMMVQSAEKSYHMENREYYPKTGSTADIQAINENLNVYLPEENNPKWNYTVRSDGSIVAVRNVPDGRTWRLDVSSEEPVCTGKFCP